MPRRTKLRRREPIAPLDELEAEFTLATWPVDPGPAIPDSALVERLHELRHRWREIRAEALAYWSAASRSETAERLGFPVPFAVVAFETRPGCDPERRARRLGILVRRGTAPTPAHPMADRHEAALRGRWTLDFIRSALRPQPDPGGTRRGLSLVR